MFKKINEKVQDLVNKIVAFFQSDFFKNLLNSTRSFFTAKFELIDQDDRLIDPLKDEILYYSCCCFFCNLGINS